MAIVMIVSPLDIDTVATPLDGGGVSVTATLVIQATRTGEASSARSEARNAIRKSIYDDLFRQLEDAQTRAESAARQNLETDKDAAWKALIGMRSTIRELSAKCLG